MYRMQNIDTYNTMRLDRNFTFTRIWEVQFIPLVATGFHGEDLSM